MVYAHWGFTGWFHSILIYLLWSQHVINLGSNSCGNNYQRDQHWQLDIDNSQKHQQSTLTSMTDWKMSSHINISKLKPSKYMEVIATRKIKGRKDHSSVSIIWFFLLEVNNWWCRNYIIQIIRKSWKSSNSSKLDGRC